jgi:hypothetical protein
MDRRLAGREGVAGEIGYNQDERIECRAGSATTARSGRPEAAAEHA